MNSLQRTTRGISSGIAVLAVFAAYPASGFIREVIYLLLPLSVGILFIHMLMESGKRHGGAWHQRDLLPLEAGQMAWSHASVRFVTIYASLTVGSLVFSTYNGALGRGLAETLFVVGSLLTALSVTLLGWRESGRDEWLERLTRLLAIFSLCMLLFEAGKVLRQGAAIEFGSFLKLFVLSSSATEHSVTPNLGFLFGAVTVFMAIRRRWLWMAAPLLLVLLSGKRIVWLGLAGSLGWWLVAAPLSSRFHWARRSQHLIVPAAAGLSLFLLLRFADGGFDLILARWTGLDANLLSMGRRALFELALTLQSAGWLPMGIGATTKMLLPYESLTGLANLHSDILKIYLEYGVLFSLGVLAAFLVLCRRSPAVTSLMLYYLVLFVTDNVSVYFEVGLFIFLMAFSLSAVDAASSPQQSLRVQGIGVGRSGTPAGFRRFRLEPLG